MRAIKGLAAVVLIVKDPAAQKRFYTEQLGLEVEADYGDAIFLRCGEQKLALFAKSHHPEGTARLEGAPKGISHLEFLVSREDEEELSRRLTEAGFHTYRGNFQDADGNLFHFVTE